MEAFKSPRQLEEDLKIYQRKRFEHYMLDVDAGKIPQQIAIAALRDEVAFMEIGAND